MTTPRILPARPSLESLRKQAKKLARDIAAGNADAIARAHAQLPRAELPLSQRDAQLVLAREYGFAGWQHLREEVLKRTGNSSGVGRGPGPARHSQQRHRTADTTPEGTSRLAGMARRIRRDAIGIGHRIVWRQRRRIQRTALHPGGMRRVADRRGRGGRRHRCAMASSVRAPAGCCSCFSVKACCRARSDSFRRLAISTRFAPSLDEHGNDQAAVNEAFMCACGFKHKEVASLLLDRCIALEPDLGRRIDAWQGRSAFIDYLGEHGDRYGSPWHTLVVIEVRQAIVDDDLPAFSGWLEREPYLLGESTVGVQVGLLELATYNNRERFIVHLLDRAPAMLQDPTPPPSNALGFALRVRKRPSRSAAHAHLAAAR